jgi:hypothetical protein
MCPACLMSAALIAGGTTAGSGAVALIAWKIVRPRQASRRAAARSSKRE